MSIVFINALKQFEKGCIPMNLKEFLKSFCVNIKDSISRFLTAFICTAIIFLVLSYNVVFGAVNDKIILSLCFTCGLIAVLSVLFSIIQEYIYAKLAPVIQFALCVLSGVVCFILIRKYYYSVYTVMAYTGIITALLCFIFYVLMRGENRDFAFPKLVSSWIFTGAICAVISLGLTICIGAFELLIYTFDNFYKLYYIVNLFVWVVGFINIFLSFIPKKDIPVQQSKIFRTFVLFAGLPIYILLIVILLVYLAKITVKWDMPSGEINTFASLASLFFIFFLLSTKQYTEKTAKLFVKFGGYFLIPVLVMQIIAVFERINAYGLTVPRTISLVLIIISILFILCSVVAPKQLNKIPLISGIIVLIVTVTPLNVIDMPVVSQTCILKTVLTENNMLRDGRVIPNPNIDDKSAERITSAYGYLKYNAKKTPGFIQEPEKSFDEIFGFYEKR